MQSYFINSICFKFTVVSNFMLKFHYNRMHFCFISAYESSQCRFSSNPRFLWLTCPWILPCMDLVQKNTASLANPNNVFSTQLLPRHLRNIIQYVSDQTSLEHVLSKGHKYDLLFPSIVLWCVTTILENVPSSLYFPFCIIDNIVIYHREKVTQK